MTAVARRIPADLVAVPPRTLQEDRLIAGWLYEYKSAATKDAYERDLKAFHAFLGGLGINLLDATPEQRPRIAAWAETLRRAGRSEASVARGLSAVSSFYRYAVQMAALSANPAKDVRRPKISAEGDGAAWMDVKQTKRFLDAARGHSPKAFALSGLMLTSAARVSEVSAADVTDLRTTGGHSVLTVTRKGGSRQNLIVYPWVTEAIAAYLDGRADGPLFLNRNGQRVTRRQVHTLVTTIARRAGLEDLGLHPHSLRHTALTLGAQEDGVDLLELQEWAGHVDSRTTRRYVHMAQRLDKSPTYRLGATLAPRLPTTQDGDRP